MDEQKKHSDRTTKELILSDGRTLGYAEYGKTDGFPVMAFHGTPGSRIWFEDNDKVSQELNIRLITVDRPGYGLSTPKPKRKILDFNNDIIELVNTLQIDKLSVLGVSGGGVYAAVFGYKNPNIIFKAGLISTINEFHNGKPPQEMCKPNKYSFLLANYFPWLLRLSFKQQKSLIENKPELYLKSIQSNISHLCNSDQEVTLKKDSAEWMLMHMKEAFRNRATEAVYEMMLLSKKWGINIHKIECPVEIWHGTADTLAPVYEIKKLAELIPNCHLNLVDNKGHFIDDDPNTWRKILFSLIPDSNKIPI